MKSRGGSAEKKGATWRKSARVAQPASHTAPRRRTVTDFHAHYLAMGNNPSTAARPEEPAPPTPGGGLPQHRSPNGGQLFKFVEDAYQVVSVIVHVP